MKSNRRNVLKLAGLAGAGYAAHLLTGVQEAKGKKGEAPWMYRPLSPEETAQRAYDLYPGHGCMYAVFNSIIGQLAEKHGEPFASFPVDMLNYGHGGAGGYGSLCGALNGAAMAIGSFYREKGTADPLVQVLFKWYEVSSLPEFEPVAPQIDRTIAQEISGSVLCHVSVARWCMAAQVGPKDDLRTERCRRLSGDVAAKTVGLLNEFANTLEVPTFTFDAASAECMDCHSTKEAIMYQSNTKMGCGSCHANPHEGGLSD